MMLLHRHYGAGTVVLAMLLLTASPVLLTPSVVAHGTGPGKAVSATRAKPTIALFAGGADQDLKVFRDTLEQLPGVKFKADELKFSDFRRDGGLFTEFLPIEIPDLSKTDIGAIAKAVASANTSKKERTPPALFLVIRYKPDSTKNEPLRAALVKVKGVHANKSWAGDQNIWVSVDGSGQGSLAEITRALHGAGIPIRNPITDISDQP